MSGLRVTILGCGSSGGVPRVAMGWGACDPAEPRNRRRRCSILVERGRGDAKTTVLIDTSPDLREQLLDADVRRLDAVLFTHEHADHTHGIDDLRGIYLSTRRRISTYADATTQSWLNERFGYCFATPAGSGYPPILDAHIIDPEAVLRIEGPGGAIDFTPFWMEHGPTMALGFRFGNTAYAPDVSLMPEASIAKLQGLDLLLLDALRYTPHPTHFSVAEALAMIERLAPRRAVLTNLHSDIDYAVIASEAPDGVLPAFDGMMLDA